MFGLHPAGNDNLELRKVYADEPECLPHIAAARYLIDKYIGEYWKHDCNHIDFIYQEIELCRYLLMPSDSPGVRKLTIKWLARALNVHPLRLFNDPNLPF